MCNMRGDQLAQLVERENYAIQIQVDVLGYIAYAYMYLFTLYINYWHSFQQLFLSDPVHCTCTYDLKLKFLLSLPAAFGDATQ